LAKLKKSGVLIVRKIFSTEQAEQWNKELIDYLESNGKEALKPKSLNLHDSYWSKPQIQARHHPNMILLQKALNGLWNKKAGIDDCVDLTKLLTYNDRLRMRNPGHHSFLYPHLDNGTISRWSDSVSQETFKQIFDGQWEDYDPFCVNGRGFTRFDGTCTFFRTFQGWVSLSEAGPGDGTLTVLPLLKESLASVLIRPLLEDIPKDQFPDYKADSVLFIDKELHADLIKAMISVPKIYPGDCVFWHGDLVHAVEPSHDGTKTNTVMYIPAGPDCPLNRMYIEKAKLCFQSGSIPPDFDDSNLPSRGKDQKKFKGSATLEDLDANAKSMMGFYN